MRKLYIFVAAALVAAALYLTAAHVAYAWQSLISSEGEGKSLILQWPRWTGPFLKGQVMVIRWSSGRVGPEEPVTIALVRDGEPEYFHILAERTANDGMEEVVMPSVPDGAGKGDLRFRLFLSDEPSVGDVSGAPFGGACRGFTERFEQGLRPDRWCVYLKKWGRGNNGAVPDNVSVEKDRVDGVRQNVTVLCGHGDRYFGSVKGVSAVREAGGIRHVQDAPGFRVGACIATRDYFASGAYEVRMKVDKTPSPCGMCIGAWLFHYEEHRGAQGDGSGLELNDSDPLYQPRFRNSAGPGAFYSSVNSEIDAPEMGHSRNGDFFTRGAFNTFVTANDQEKGATFQSLPLLADGASAADGKYHRYRWEWRTGLEEITGLADDKFAVCGNYHYVHEKSSPFQGMAAVKRNSKWYACTGRDVTFYVDGRKIGSSTENVPAVSARLVIGVWFPFWAGPADWEKAGVSVAEVSVKPWNMEGDVLNQPETWPGKGLKPPPERLRR